MFARRILPAFSMLLAFCCTSAQYHQAPLVRGFQAPYSYPVTKWGFRPIFPPPRSYHAKAAAAAGYKKCTAVAARVDMLSGVNEMIGGALFLHQPCDGQPVHVTGTLTGLSPGKHGLHVHGTPNLGNKCSDAGGHYNPFNINHGAQTNSIESRHVGDLGNILADHYGNAKVDITDPIISLFPGKRGVIRRAMVLHSGEDDLGLGGNEGSLKTGNAGQRLGCGIIAPNNPQH